MDHSAFAALAERHRRGARRAAVGSPAEVSWLQPYPDPLLDAAGPGDAEAALAIAARDIRVTMPPLPYCFAGREQLRPLLADAAAMGEWRLVPVRANRMPAAASYLRRPGERQFRAFKLDVPRAEAGVIAEITTFNPDLFPAFGLGETL